MKKIALVTGSGSGIGKQIGLDLLKINYKVIFNDIDNDALNRIRKENIAFKNSIDIWKADLSNIHNIKNLSKINSIDVLIMNAGITDRTEFGNIKYSVWNNVFNTNLTVPFFLIQKMKDNINNNGRIIFISSILGDKPHSRSISYGVSKAGVNALVRNLVKHFASRKITVNAVAPGFVDSDWHKDKTDEQIERIINKIALKRFANKSQISSIVKEIIRNDYINGQIITIDGGYDYE